MKTITGSAENDPAHPSHSNHLISTKGKKAERVWYPDVSLLSSVRNELIDKCVDNKLEVCGFISAEWDIYEIENTHSCPKSNFYIDEEIALETIQKIYDIRESHIIALWHTHPTNLPWPSPRDIRGWPNPVLGWRYLIATNDEVYEWELVDE